MPSVAPEPGEVLEIMTAQAPTNLDSLIKQPTKVGNPRPVFAGDRVGRQDVNELKPVEIVTEQVSSLAFSYSRSNTPSCLVVLGDRPLPIRQSKPHAPGPCS